MKSSHKLASVKHMARNGLGVRRTAPNKKAAPRRLSSVRTCAQAQKSPLGGLVGEGVKKPARGGLVDSLRRLESFSAHL